MRIERWILIALLIASGGGFSACYGRPGRMVSAHAMSQPAPEEMRGLSRWLGESSGVITSEHFVVCYERDRGYARDLSRVLEGAYRQFFSTFGGALADPTASERSYVWICFDDSDSFNRYAMSVDRLDRSWLDSYYSTRTNRVALIRSRVKSAISGGEGSGSSLSDDLTAIKASRIQTNDSVLPMADSTGRFELGRLTHELAHQLAFNSGLQKRGVMYPFWISEGLATSFEFDDASRVGAGAGTTVRLPCVLDTRTSGELVPLRQFIVQAGSPIDPEASRRHYAQAWSLFQYALNERSSELAQYLQYVRRLNVGRRDVMTLRREFIAAFGSPEAFERAWMEFLDGQAELSQSRHRLIQTADSIGVSSAP